MERILAINQQPIIDFISKGFAETIDRVHCDEFDNYVSTDYPWEKLTGYRIDWQNFNKPYKRLKWDEASDEDVIEFLKKTSISKFDEVCIIYSSAKEEGLVVSFDFACKHIYELLPDWGTRFMVGVERNGYGIAKLVNPCFIEIDCEDWLTSPEIGNDFILKDIKCN